MRSASRSPRRSRPRARFPPGWWESRRWDASTSACRRTSSCSTTTSRSTASSWEARPVSSPERVPPGPGEKLLAEIREQPAALRALLGYEAEYAKAAAAARERRATTVRMVGHGSSDNAAAYGVYAFGLLPGWTALRDSITLSVYYGAQIDMAGSTAIALSQSGRTLDVVDYLGRARSTGAFTVALTNDPASDLAREAEAVLPLAAGTESSVAATKTYLNQVAALGLLAAHAAGAGRRFDEGLRVVSGQMEELYPRIELLVPRVDV